MKVNPKTGYSAIAAAVAVACGAAYAASPVATSPVNFSAEGNALAPATSNGVYTAPVSVTLGSDYIVNDTVELGITGASFVTGTSTLGTGFNGTVSCVSGSNSMSLGFLSRSATSANYRVTAIAGTQNAAVCSFSLPIARSSLGTAGAVPTVSWTAKTAQSGLVFDAASGGATLGTVRSQFVSPASTSVTRLGGTVDVNAGRYQFVGGHDEGSVLSAFTGGSSDTLSFTLGNRSTDNGAATLTSVVGVLKGDFSFVDGGNATAGCQAGDLTAGHGRISASGASLSINSACDELTFTTSAAQFTATTGAVKISFGTSSGSTTPTNGSFIDAPQEFSVDSLVYSYAGANAGTTGSKDVGFSATKEAGEWDLNGLSAKISYIPYGEGISRIIYITNRSTQTGGVSATAIDDKGQECEIASVATSARGSVTLLSAGLDAGVRACWGETYSGRVAFDITANVPATAAEVYSAYNVNGNRVSVINNTNGK